MPRTILHIDLDAFFVSVERRFRPELEGKPVVVGGNPLGRGVVASASYEARRYGLKAGMPLSTARRLCPQAIFLTGDFSRYQQASAGFMDILERFSPFLDPGGIDEAYLDLTGFESLYGPARQVALDIKRLVRQELGLTASVGIASCKVVAKVASDLSKPDGLLEVSPGQEAAFLAPLPVASLPGVGPSTGQMLKGLGVSTIGDLARLPVSALKGRLGIRGQVLHDHARGIDDSRLKPPAAARSISRETTLPQDSLDRVLLTSLLRYLSERVGAELRRQEKLAACVFMKLRYDDFDTISRQLRLRSTSDSDQAIFNAGRHMLDRELSRRCQRIRLIGIGVEDLVPPARQLGLWDNDAARWDRLNRAIDRLRGKYGFTAIETGRTLSLRNVFDVVGGDYRLMTPALSR